MEVNSEITDNNNHVDEKLLVAKKRAFEDSENGKTETKRAKLLMETETIANVSKTPKKKTNATNNAKVSQNPKKRLDIVKSSTNSSGTQKKKFIYGNYNQYYGYRNNKGTDVRLDLFATRPELLQDKQVLDIGCNNGHLTMQLAERFLVRNITGLDIDRELVSQAVKKLIALKKSKPKINPDRKACRYPYNVSFVHGNYVLRDDVLLEIECAQYDLILCLSVTKWIQLNFADAGLKQAFRRMFLQLRPGGKLILEAQSYDNYGKRKHLTAETYANYTAMQFMPADFTKYLLSPDVGFASVEFFGVPEHIAAGFKRPIQIFIKS